MKFTRLALIALLTVCLLNNAVAQDPSKKELYKITQVSPNAASLGKYGEYPVGLYTGIPSINIPFYEINTGRIKLPISISYNAGGIKVEEIASSVGLGWALNAGGVITRSIRGIPDEEAAAGGDRFISTALTTDSLVNLFNNTTLPDYFTIVPATFKKVVGARIDAEPDVFYYNFAGQSGKFMYHQKDGKFYTIPYSNLKISFGNNLAEFYVTDENGLYYTFSDQELSTRGSDPLTVTNAWYLSSILDPSSGKTVSFRYRHKTINYETMSSDVHYFNEQLIDAKSNKQNSLHTITVLDQITFDNGKLNFNYGMSRADLPGDSALTEIKIVDSSNQVVKRYGLDYDYYLSQDLTGGGGVDKRLRLLATNEYSSVGSEAPLAHGFQYNGTPLPSRLSKAQDHWGYYNGVSNSVLYPPLFYPSVWSNITLPGADRKIYPSYTQAGILNKITYPTKGYTTFEYENNTSGTPDVPAEEKLTGTIVPIGTEDYAEGDFSVMSMCIGEGGAWVTLNVNGFDFDAIPNGWPGHVIKISYQNVATSQIHEVYWIGDGKGGNLNPVTLFLSNGNYKLIVDCVGNVYTDSYSAVNVSLTWNECPPVTDMEANNKLVGGLRIKKVKNFDDQDGLLGMKHYKYVKEDNPLATSGESSFYPRYFSVVSYTPDIPEIVPKDCIKRYSQSNYPLVDESGKSVGYSNVIELNGEDETNGYTQYKFSNFSHYPDEQNMSLSVSQPTSYQWLRGLEMERKIFKYNGTNNELLYSVVNEYDTTLLVSKRKMITGIRGVFTWHIFDREADWPAEDYYFLGAISTAWEKYGVHSDFVYLKKSTERSYTGSNYVEKVTDYTYNDRNLKPSMVETSGGNGGNVVEVTKYPLDFTVNNASHPKTIPIKNLQEFNYVTTPIEQYRYRKLSTNNQLLLGANYYSYRADFPIIDTVFTLKQNAAPTYNYNGISTTSGTFIKHPKYEADIIVESYADANNIAQQKKDGGTSFAYLWNYQASYPVTEVKHAKITDIAYTSFEGDDKGKWVYNGVPLPSLIAKTGDKVYSLQGGDLVRSGLQTTKKYQIEFWARDVVSLSVNGIVPVQLETQNGWIHFSCQLSGVTTITLSGSATIDEVRLMPVNAQMTTYTFKPLVGMTSLTDSKGQTTYYNYDTLNRLAEIKDEYGNIIKNYSYHYKP